MKIKTEEQLNQLAANLNESLENGNKNWFFEELLKHDKKSLIMLVARIQELRHHRQQRYDVSFGAFLRWNNKVK